MTKRVTLIKKYLTKIQDTENELLRICALSDLIDEVQRNDIKVVSENYINDNNWVSSPKELQKSILKSLDDETD